MNYILAKASRKEVQEQARIKELPEPAAREENEIVLRMTCLQHPFLPSDF
jgi:hypothetical protein